MEQITVQNSDRKEQILRATAAFCVRQGLAEPHSSSTPILLSKRISFHDRESVKWGGCELTFRAAPGHTDGTLMITFPLTDEDGKTYLTGMLCGLGPGKLEFTQTCKQLQKL